MKKELLRKPVAVMLCTLCLCLVLAVPVSGATIIDEWGAVVTPAAPQLKEIKLPAATTALLLLDFNKQICNDKQRPRCVSSVPAVSRLLGEARKANILVVYSHTMGSSSADIAPALAPRPGDPIVISGPDKFLGTELEKILKERNIKTVIVTGTAAHGAVICTASGAALRGIKVVIPVDGISAESLYPEQYTVWHLLNAPRISTMSTVTKTDMIQIGIK
ncbi:MAG: cysteine hydrolase [Syntrophus sp. (in: bacteria)]